jgi:hypothetical protein
LTSRCPIAALEEEDLFHCNLSPAPGISAGKESIEDENLLDEEHFRYQSLVGKLQWLPYKWPDMARAIKELARGVQLQSTIKNSKKLIRYLAGRASSADSATEPWTSTVNTYVDTAGKLSSNTPQHDWALRQFLGIIHCRSRTRAILALSSAEAEFYAVGRGIREALCTRNSM